MGNGKRLLESIAKIKFMSQEASWGYVQGAVCNGVRTDLGTHWSCGKGS